MSYDYKKFTVVAAVTIALLILVSICFSVVNQYVDTGDNGKITTEAALYGEVSDSIQTQGFAVREEEVINLRRAQLPRGKRFPGVCGGHYCGCVSQRE